MGDRPSAESAFDLSSRTKLTTRDLGRFPGVTLLHKVGRVVCEAGCLRRRELFEAWEVARRTRRKMRGGRVVDLACGHGLVAWLMLLLDDTSPAALAADAHLPPSAASIAAAMTSAWPRLAGRVTLEQRRISDVPLDARDVVVATHACGALTDAVIDRVLEPARASRSCRAVTTRRRATREGCAAGWIWRLPWTRRGQRGCGRADTPSRRSSFRAPSRRRTGCSSGRPGKDCSRYALPSMGCHKTVVLPTW
jgi:hypothetical protein